MFHKLCIDIARLSREAHLTEWRIRRQHQHHDYFTRHQPSMFRRAQRCLAVPRSKIAWLGRRKYHAAGSAKLSHESASQSDHDPGSLQTLYTAKRASRGILAMSIRSFTLRDSCIHSTRRIRKLCYNLLAKCLEKIYTFGCNIGFL